LAQLGGLGAFGLNFHLYVLLHTEFGVATSFSKKRK
jgi:hypothetical protein